MNQVEQYENLSVDQFFNKIENLKLKNNKKSSKEKSNYLHRKYRSWKNEFN